MNDLTVPCCLLLLFFLRQIDRRRKENLEYNLDRLWSEANDFIAILLASWRRKVPSFHLRSVVYPGLTNIIIDNVVIYLPEHGRKEENLRLLKISCKNDQKSEPPFFNLIKNIISPTWSHGWYKNISKSKH